MRIVAAAIVITGSVGPLGCFLYAALHSLSLIVS